MKLSHKIYGIIAIFTVPLLGLTVYFVITGINKDIDFGAKEVIGNVYQRPLESVMEHFSQHQILTQRSLAGDKSVSSALSEAKTQVDRDIEKLIEVDTQHGVTLQFTKEGLAERKRSGRDPATLKQNWAALASQNESVSADVSRTKHFELITHVRDMISHSGDKSNLILDPDLDSYYMMDMTLIRLPVEQERIAMAMAFGMDVLGRKTVTKQESRQLDVFASMFREVDRGNVVTDMQTALDEDKNFYGVSPSLQSNLKPKVDASAASAESFAVLLEQLAGSEKVEMDKEKFLAAGKQAREDSYRLWDVAANELDALLKLRIGVFADKRQYAMLFTALALIASLIISFFIIRAITQSVETVAGELHELSSEDANLTRRIPVQTADEVGRLSKSFNSLMDKLLGLVRQVQQSGTQVTSSSTQIAASTKELEAAVNEQASSTNEVVATTKEISATAQTLVATMNEVSKVASETAVLAGGGRGDLDGMESTMRQLASATISISSKLAAISEKANNINKVVVTITKVADQTNLLSLNASIEAEKAGEHGLGFAVVAREIRRLADQTAVATLDIERMVREMQSAVSTGVMEMDKFTKDVTHGVDEVNKIGAQLNKIIERVQVLAPRFESITDGMQAQSQGAQQINSAMVQLSEAARQTMDSLRQTNGAISELNSAARGLHQEVSRFNTAAVAGT